MLMVIINILIFILILGFLILVHEFAHFKIGRKVKARIDEFCIGFPPRIYKKKIKKTLYSIGAIPAGGFCKFYGEEDSSKKSKGAFFSLSVGKRFWIIIAGVLANLLIGIVFFSISFMIGYPQIIEGGTPANVKEAAIHVWYVAKDSPADKAGFFVEDKIVSISEEKDIIFPKEVEDVQNFLSKNKGKEIVVMIQRGKKNIEKKVLVRENPPEYEGPTGVMLIKKGIISYSWYGAIGEAFKEAYKWTKGTFLGIGLVIKNAITGKKTPGAEVSSIVGIGNIFNQFAAHGFVYIIYFAALLSWLLGIFNIIPIPALDGGRLLFLGIEKIKKRPVKHEFEEKAILISFIMLIILVVLITIKDIKNIFF